MVELHSFTKNYQDESTGEGFQFKFLCDSCGEGYETEFIESKTAKSKERMNMVSRGIDFLGGDRVSRGIDILADGDRSAEWEREHDKVFKEASGQAMKNFTRCPRCHSYVCETCWNEERNLCIQCAPRVGVEMSAAKADVEISQMREKVGEMKIFSGDTSDREVICPKCGKPSGAGKFCTNCGAPLGANTCPKCGASVAAGQKFCGTCGAKVK